MPYKEVLEFYATFQEASDRYDEVHNAIWNGGYLKGSKYSYYSVMPPQKIENSWQLEIGLILKKDEHR